MTVRMQLYLDEEHARQLEYVARARRVSKSKLIRQSLARYLHELIPPEADPALQLIGLAGKVGLDDLSERHDEYLHRHAR